MFLRFIPRSGKARRMILLAGALLLAALVAIPISGVALAQSPPPDTDSITLVNRDRQMVERKKEGDFVARPVFSRQTERPLLRHPPPGHRRVDHQHLPGPGRREAALRGLGVHLRVPGPGRAARAPPRTALPAGAGSAANWRRRPPCLPRPDSRPPAQGTVGPGAGRPGPRPLGAGRRQMGDPGSPRDPVRRGGEDRPDRSSRVRGVAVWATSSPEPLPS